MLPDVSLPPTEAVPAPEAENDGVVEPVVPLIAPVP